MTGRIAYSSIAIRLSRYCCTQIMAPMLSNLAASELALLTSKSLLLKVVEVFNLLFDESIMVEVRGHTHNDMHHKIQ